MCGKIIISTACLHNLCIQNGMPPPPNPDNDEEDGLRRPRRVNGQPFLERALGRPQVANYHNRAHYIQTHFRGIN